MSTIRPIKISDSTGTATITSAGVEVTTPTSSGDAVISKVTGDTQPRFIQKTDGSLIWGPGGSSGQDIRIRRLSAYNLTIDDNTTGGSVLVYFTPSTDAKAALGTNNRRFLDIVGNTHRVFKSAGDANASTSVTDGAIRFGAGGASALDVQFIRSNTNTVRFDNNASGNATFIVNNSIIVRSFGNGDSLKLLSVPGTITMGSGAASTNPDVRIYRSGTKTITIDDISGGAAGLTVAGMTKASGGLSVATTTKSSTNSPYTISDNDQFIFCNMSTGAMTLTLPAASSNNGRLITIKITVTSGSNNIIVQSSGGTIEGSASFTITGSTRATTRFVSDGSNWWQI